MTRSTTLIRGGTVFDGVSPDGVVQDVLVSDGRVVDMGVGLGVSAARTIDASGAWVTPGFIDAHSHCDLSALTGTAMEVRARAGITTEIVGQDGLGFAPVDTRAGDIMAETLEPIVGPLPETGWATIADYLSEVDRGSYARIATLAPHGALRAQISGRSDRPLTTDEVGRMRQLVRHAVADGAVGLSTGLSYAPALWASTAELIAVTSALPPGTPYVTHLRDYGANFDEALAEAVSIGAESDRPVHLSHFHVSGAGREGQASAYLNRLARASRSGAQLSWDSYPYVHACTFVTTVLPRSLQALSLAQLGDLLGQEDHAADVAAQINAAGTGATVAVGWDALLLAGLDGTSLARWGSKSIGAVAAETRQSPGDVLVEVIRQLAGRACILVEQGHRPNIIEIANHPNQVVGSDGIPGCGVPHPRAGGSFLRFLRWARDGVVSPSVGEMVTKMTSRTAELFQLSVGRLGPGAPADLVVIDPESLDDGPDIGWHEPDAVRHSFIAGELVIDDGKWVGTQLPGLALSRKET